MYILLKSVATTLILIFLIMSLQCANGLFQVLISDPMRSAHSMII